MTCAHRKNDPTIRKKNIIFSLMWFFCLFFLSVGRGFSCNTLGFPPTPSILTYIHTSLHCRCHFFFGFWNEQHHFLSNSQCCFSLLVLVLSWLCLFVCLFSLDRVSLYRTGWVPQPPGCRKYRHRHVQLLSFQKHSRCAFVSWCLCSFYIVPYFRTIYTVTM